MWSLDGDVDVDLPICDEVLNRLQGRRVAFFGAELERDGLVRIVGEVSLLKSTQISPGLPSRIS